MIHTSVDKGRLCSFQSLNKFECTNLQRSMCCGWAGASMRAIRCVSGEASKCGSTLTLMNDLSRRCPTHAQLPLLPRRGTALVCMCGEKGTYLCMSSCLRGRVLPCTRAAECVLFWQPSVTHVNDTTQTLHESAVWVQGVSETAKSTGLNTLTPA